MLALLAMATFHATAGCARAPSIRDLSPAGAQQLRADIARVGVRTDPPPATLTFRQPAKGAWGGAQRGALVGGAAPIALGAVIPLPGTTILGALAAPFTAVAGMVYGAVVSPPRDEVEAAEAGLARAVERIRATQPLAHLQARVIELGNATSGRSFLALDAAPEDVDAVLALAEPRAGLEGAWRIDPPSIAFAEVHIRLATPSGEVLMEEVVFCSGEERSYVEWARDDAAPFASAIRSCADAIAEKVVDDFFRVRPAPERRLD